LARPNEKFHITGGVDVFVKTPLALEEGDSAVNHMVGSGLARQIVPNCIFLKPSMVKMDASRQV
jgi:hypothetical protein